MTNRNRAGDKCKASKVSITHIAFFFALLFKSLNSKTKSIAEWYQQHRPSC